jgi:hypothetical protein
MDNVLDQRPRSGVAAGDGYYDRHAEESSRELAAMPVAHPMDSDASRALHRKLLEWYYFEKDKQAQNRLEMALDADMYDNIQWDPNDAALLAERGQMPLVFNEVAPMCDWVIGTERRTRVDWSVLPRTEDDVQMADIKTKTLKYSSDINRTAFNRSRSFTDAVKAGVGWIDDGVRDDPTKDIIYNKYEDWRCVLWDSSSYELDLSDARYLFRWRWVDEDIAVMMFPDREDQIRAGVEDAAFNSIDDDEFDWYSAEELMGQGLSGTIKSGGAGSMVDAKRRRVKLIECQYRMPVKSKIISSGPLKGAFFNEQDQGLVGALNKFGGSIIDKVVMRTHIAVFTEADMMAAAPSIYRHNNFSLTPIWFYRRGKDRMPYGAIRRVRDIQRDLNKRASKALWLLNTNQTISEAGAVEDMDATREEVNRPDGDIVVKAGKRFEINRDTDAATGQIQMMSLDAQSIQKSAGVADENLGRQTNAVSGEAIKARQLQGSVVTTEPFDNLRYAVQVSGEKQLSLVEQFYSEEKVIRLTGAKGRIDWVRINQPEQQPDGSVRWINDITESMADFIVSEADYAGTMRQVLFEAMNNIAARLPPDVSLRLLTIAMEFSDMPNKDEIAEALRAITGERDPDKEMTPEEAQAAQEQMQIQAEALQVQRESAMLALQEQQAKVRELNAKAMKLEGEAQTAAAGGMDGQGQAEVAQALAQVRQQAAQEIDKLTEALRKAQSDLANRTMQIRADADTKLESARIDADAKVRMAEIQAVSDKAIEKIQQRLDQVVQSLEAKMQKHEIVKHQTAAAEPKK